MRVLVFGPTGGTGLELCAQAIGRGHDVTAFARSPSKLTESSLKVEGVAIIEGDVMNADDVTSAVRKAAPEAVLIALGGGGIWSRDYTCSTGTTNIISALKATGASQRIVVCTSMGVGDSASLVPAFVRWLLKYPLADKEPQEESVRASGLPYVIVRPTGLRNAPPKGTAAVAARIGEKLPTSAIARADVATFMLDALENDTYLGKAVGIAWDKS